ncbi:MAG: fibronectin type III domain-containing protein [Anaerolineales bacterium]|nr:fibronectin type III domain-containing protein [Anaerolineales bacterium]
MDAITHNRHTFMLAIIITLIGSAICCGRSQPTNLALAPPTNCEWKAASVPQVIELKWDYASGQDIDGFRVYQGTTSLELELKSNARGASIPNLEPGTQYHFDVRAYKGNTESEVDACFVDATTGQ